MVFPQPRMRIFCTINSEHLGRLVSTHVVFIPFIRFWVDIQSVEHMTKIVKVLWFHHKYGRWEMYCEMTHFVTDAGGRGRSSFLRGILFVVEIFHSNYRCT